MKQVAIFSVPRSGSTWLGQIFNSHPEVLYRFQPNMAYTFPLTLGTHSTRAEIESFYKELCKTDDPFTTARISVSGKPNPAFNKTTPTTVVFKEVHYIGIVENLIRNSGTQVIGLVRSPLATLYSWSKAPREFHPDWDLQKEWMDAPRKNQDDPRNYFGYRKWKEVLQFFLRLEKQYPDRFLLLQYERLLAHTEETVENAFRFCHLEPDPQTRAFLDQAGSKDERNDTYSVFRTKKDDRAWETDLPAYIREAILGDPAFQGLNKRFQWV